MTPKQISLYVPDFTLREFDELCKKRGTTRSALIIKAMRRELREQYDGREALRAELEALRSKLETLENSL